KPKIPPAKLTQDHVAQGRRVVQDEPRGRPLRRNIERGACAETRSVEHDWLAIRMALQFVERRERCRPDPRKARRSGATAESGIIHSPDLHGSIVPFVGFGCDPALRTIRIAVEPQNVNIRTAVLLRSLRYGRP